MGFGRAVGWGSSNDSDDLRTRIHQRAPVPVSELLLDRKSGVGQEDRRRVHVEEPQRTFAYLRLAPARACEGVAETNDVPFEGIVDLGRLAA
ncbi:uncharacterized protein METZ01_LOCUS262832 [marine metagenome]|uniref:Uncharacterized protein n=1 Tax=marine metagenome TaxID=408172 RepID=A0A382JE19_9ZZZZ